MNYSTDHGSSYGDRERNSPSFFLYISQMLNMSTFVNPLAPELLFFLISAHPVYKM